MISSSFYVEATDVQFGGEDTHSFVIEREDGFTIEVRPVEEDQQVLPDMDIKVLGLTGEGHLSHSTIIPQGPGASSVKARVDGDFNALASGPMVQRFTIHLQYGGETVDSTEYHPYLIAYPGRLVVYRDGDRVVAEFPIHDGIGDDWVAEYGGYAGLDPDREDYDEIVEERGYHAKGWGSSRTYDREDGFFRFEVPPEDFEFEEEWDIKEVELWLKDGDGNPIHIARSEYTPQQESRPSPMTPRSVQGADTPTTNPDRHSQLQDATTVATVTIDGHDYRVLQEIPGEPSDRFAYTDEQYHLLEPTLATNVSISYTYCNAYSFNSERRLEYTNEQYEEMGDLEQLARAADLLSEISGVLALAKINPKGAAVNAVDALQTAVEWGAHELNDPYHEQFSKMAAACSTVDWADKQLPHSGGALVDPADDVLEVTQTMLQAAEAIDAAEDLATSAATVYEIVRHADSIRDHVSPGAVDGADDLASTGFTLLYGLAVTAAVDSVSGVAEGQARVAAIGKGQAAARRPLLNELLELEARARNFDLGPAGVLRMQTLHQTDYQIEAAALYGQASILENYQSGRLGSIVAAVYGTDELPSTLRSTAETYRDLSGFQFAGTGELFKQALEAYSDSINADEYGDQELLKHP